MKKNKKSSPNNQPIVNRRARFDYELKNELTVGMVLSGQEVRAARDGHIQLKGAFVTIKDNELWLNNASFSIRHNQKGESGARTIDTKPRKLLANRKQIDNLKSQKHEGLTIVPVRLLNTGHYIKLVISLGKGKKLYDKREVKKRRDEEREIGRAMKR